MIIISILFIVGVTALCIFITSFPIIILLLFLSRNAKRLHDMNIDTINHIGKHVKSVKEAKSNSANAETPEPPESFEELVTKHNISDKEILNYTIKKYGRGVKK